MQRGGNRVSSMAGVAMTLAATLMASGCATGPEPAAPVWQAGSPGSSAIAPPSPSPSVTASPTPSSSPSASPSASASASKPAPSKSAKPATYTYVFPVPGSPVSYHPTHSAYPATDIFANCGNPVLAVTDGTVVEVSRKDEFVKGRPDGPLNGGFFVSLVGDDGVRYYGSHMSLVDSGIEPGVRVRAGQRLGNVGKTGNANNVCHLHFGISPACAEAGDWWIRRGAVWPAPFLDSWREQGGASPVAKVAEYTQANGCPKAPY
ncbi:M23 family metallopeptidase [Catenuloplanes atrovinosus]|uniref:Murein DD-endopeptidase MepM/ murein hydrolase activator NlpD n=1 Tax=Catenuloplanes atrovinosus TaxID=137266 RepID=A0AAE3YWE5_9ACTN|nr:M23 family metallopeptidase [Catenuloplanes atrovinosus]MDR7279856.1 murein DD-endopeptidase MepM/ murein hydrolase activator NlpD [Catenuloplanes atrovinosus]